MDYYSGDLQVLQRVFEVQFKYETTQAETETNIGE